jgi:hypothetical protein
MDTPESYGFKGPFKKLLKENPLFLTCWNYFEIIL